MTAVITAIKWQSVNSFLMDIFSDDNECFVSAEICHVMLLLVGDRGLFALFDSWRELLC